MVNQRPTRRARIVRGTTNVIADPGFPDAAERQAKLRLAYTVNECSLVGRPQGPRPLRCWG